MTRRSGTLQERLANLLFLGLVTVVLAGCAQQRAREEAQALAREGQYEQALTRVDEALQVHPDSAVLRGQQILLKQEAVGRLWAAAARAKGLGQLEEAQQLLLRAQAHQPDDKRTAALLADLATERKQLEALARARKLWAAEDFDQADAVLAQALQDNPRHPELQALHRQVSSRLHQQQTTAARLGLAESRPISLDFRDADLRTVLDIVSRNSGINFIMDRDVRPDTRITVFLRSARVEDAIDLITSTYQLDKKVIDSQTLLIYPNTPDKQKEHREQVVKVFFLANAEAKNAASFLRGMGRLKDPYVDERTNMIAVRDSIENVQLAERLLAMFDTPEPEVLIDLEVIEVRASRLTELGVKLPTSLGLVVLPPAGEESLNLLNVDRLSRDRIGLSLGGLSVNLRRETGDYTVLANPSVRARNKEKAKVMIGDRLPLVTTTTGTGGFVSDSISYLDVGLKLEVEPTIYVDDEVAMRVSLEVSSQGSAVKTSSGGLAYQIGTRNATTLLRLRNNETQLLAGLISRDERSDASRIPGLGDLPVAGRLFSSTLDNGQRTELVLAITPRVVRNVRTPDAAESELWVGTEAAPRVRPVGGLIRPARGQPTGAGTSAGTGQAPQPGPAPVAAMSIGAGAAPGGLSGAALATTGPPAVPKLGLSWRGPDSAAVGEEFSVQLEVQAPRPLRGLPVNIGLDPSRLQLVEAEEGDFFRQGDFKTSLTRSMEADGARWRVGVMRHKAQGVQGQGSVLTLRLKALKPGPAELVLLGVNPVESDQPVANPRLPLVHRLEVR